MTNEEKKMFKILRIAFDSLTRDKFCGVCISKRIGGCDGNDINCKRLIQSRCDYLADIIEREVENNDQEDR